MKGGDHKKGAIDFEKAIEIDSEKVTAYIGLGDCNKHQRKYRDAIKLYNKALELVPSLYNLIIIKRAVCEIELNLLENAESGINQVFCSII